MDVEKANNRNREFKFEHGVWLNNIFEWFMDPVDSCRMGKGVR